MLACVIEGSTSKEIQAQVEYAKNKSQCLEFRFDKFKKIDFYQIKSLLDAIDIPIIFTFKKPFKDIYFRLCTLNPTYIDIEYDIDPTIEEEIKKISSSKIIISYHNFSNTPKDLFKLLKRIKRPYNPIYKIACMAVCIEDLFRMLIFIKSNKDVVGISLGKLGQPSRILGKIFGNIFTYCSTAKNDNEIFQLSLDELVRIYNYYSLNTSTKLFSLLGDPVDQSIGHVFHNEYFLKNNINATYVKFQVKKEELLLTLRYLKKLGFNGCSVTMPLKEEITKYLDKISHQANDIGAVNTISFVNDKIIGENNDSIAALDAIEELCNIKKAIVILGCGGAARAIAYEAKRRNANVIILNRTKSKAILYSKKINCKAGGLEDISKFKYDILINAISFDICPISHQNILPNTIVMDINYKQKQSKFLKFASKKNCKIVFGITMFNKMAILQQKYWNKTHI